MTQQKLAPQVTKFLRLKQKISKLNKQVEDLKSEASKMEKDIIIQMEEAGSVTNPLERVDVGIGSVSYAKEPVYSVKKEDWKKVWGYIFKHKDSTLLQKRLSQVAVGTLIKDGVKIDGVQRGFKKKLNPGFKKKV